MVNVTVEYPDMRQIVQAPLSVAIQLNSRERILTNSYRAKICHNAISARSYRAGYEDLNYSLYQDSRELRPFSTYVMDIVNEGQNLISEKQKQAEMVLEEYGFDGKTGLYRQASLPAYLRNSKPKMIIIDPAEVLKGITEIEVCDPEIEEPTIEEPQAEDVKEYSKPDTAELHLPNKPRSRNRETLPPEEMQKRCENFIRWREKLDNLDDDCKVRHTIELEAEPGKVVYMMIDAVYVPGQAETHVRGGKPVNDKSERVEHWNCRIEWNETDSYAVTDGNLDNTMKQTLAFLLKNGLINRYFIFFVDGEEKIFRAIDRYFGMWEYKVYLDFAHLVNKCYELLSSAIRSERVADPRGKKEYYVKGDKKGELKSQEMTSLSVLYTRKEIAMLWVNNRAEAIRYLKNIDPKDIVRPASMKALLTYLDDSRKGKYITCYAARSVAGLRNSSNGVEGLNNQSVACIQKQSNKSYRDEGSHAMASLKVLHDNHQWDNWFGRDLFTYEYDPACIPPEQINNDVIWANFQ